MVDKRLSRIGLALGAGLFGAGVMLLSQKAEMHATGREPSNTPAEAIERLTRQDVGNETREAQLSTLGHFAFGTGLGLGLIAIDRLPEPWRALLFTAGAWSIGTGLLVVLDISEPPTRWDGAQLATDLGHHAVYGAATATAYAVCRTLATVD